jgi:transcriptional regulator with XRE-family HTH domain
LEQSHQFTHWQSSRGIVCKTIKNIIKLRLQSGLSQSEVARRAGVTSSAISQLEKGTKKPSLEMLAKLAKVFNIHSNNFADPKLKTKDQIEVFYRKFFVIADLCKKDQNLILKIANRLVNKV